MAAISSSQDRIRELITDTLMVLCRNGLKYDQEFRVEGLLGITIDQKEVLLVNIREMMFVDEKKPSRTESVFQPSSSPAAPQATKPAQLLNDRCHTSSFNLTAENYLKMLSSSTKCPSSPGDLTSRRAESHKIARKRSLSADRCRGESAGTSCMTGSQKNLAQSGGSTKQTISPKRSCIRPTDQNNVNALVNAIFVKSEKVSESEEDFDEPGQSASTSVFPHYQNNGQESAGFHSRDLIPDEDPDSFAASNSRLGNSNLQSHGSTASDESGSSQHKYRLSEVIDATERDHVLCIRDEAPRIDLRVSVYSFASPHEVEEAFRRNDWRKTTTKLMGLLFTEEELLTCSVTGRTSTRNQPREALDPERVQAIVNFILTNFPYIARREVMSKMSQKLKDGRMQLTKKSNLLAAFSTAKDYDSDVTAAAAGSRDLDAQSLQN